MAKKNNKKKGISINMEGVETGTRLLPEGTYTVKISEVEVKESQSGNDYLAFTFTVVEGKNKGAKLFHNCSLQPQALFNLKALLMAIGFEIPKKTFDLDIDDLLDRECDVEVAHEKYEGKNKARIVEFIAADSDDEEEEEEEDDDEEDDDSDDEDEDEDEDDEEEEEDEEDEEDEPDYESMTLKDLKALAKERGIKVTKKMDKDDIIELLEDEE